MNLRLALAPLAWSVGGVTRLRRGAYRRGLLRSAGVGVPVVSVGSLAMGGSGKTPVTRVVARRLQLAGLRVAVVCGAYRGRSRDRVTVVSGGEPDGVDLFGDEAVMLARWLGPQTVVAGRDKLAGARLAADRGAQVIVVDDGFQHQRLARDLNIVVHGSTAFPRVVPLGAGREPGSALDDADLLWIHWRDGAARGPGPHRERPAVVSSVRPRCLTTSNGETSSLQGLNGARVCLMAGIAAPRGFRALVAGLGARIVGQVLVRDHGCFERRHFGQAWATHPDLLLCTEKDLVRMERRPGGGDLTAVVCETEVVRGSAVLDRVLGALALEGGRCVC